MVEYTDYQTEIAIIAISVFGIIIIPLIFRKLIEPRLLKFFARRQSGSARIVVRTISRFIRIWCLLLVLIVIRALFSEELSEVTNDRLILLTNLIIVLTLVWFLNRIVQESLEFYARKGKLPPTTIFSNLSKIGIFALAVTSAMWVADISIAPLIATIGIGGLAIALALQDTLSSLFAGIYIIMSKQINPGDYVRISQNEEGFIQDINWRNTTIRTRENNIIIVPNRSLANLTIINFSLLSKEMSLVIPVGVHYDTDLELAESLAIEVGKEILHEIPGGVTNFEPLIRYNAFGDSAITFNVILRIVEYTSQGVIRHNFVKRLRKRYADYGIIIPYPMRTLTFEEKIQVAQVQPTD